MKNKQLYQPFEIQVCDLENWKEHAMVYQFFEIVQILEGEGRRVTNENSFSYSKGSIFLFTPLDCRGFESSTPTRFCSIRFSPVFLEQYKVSQERDRIITWLRQLELIFNQYNRFKQLILTSDEDYRLISTLVENIVEEYEGKRAFFQENLQHFITLLLNIISRSAGVVSSSGRYEEVLHEPLINRILIYLHQHIHLPGHLRIKHLARQFNLSANYLGEYFKKLTGDSLQCYVIQYRMNIVEQRLEFSQQSIGQIADELGFSDESHLTRQFKKHRNVTPASFRTAKRRETI